MMSAMVNRPSDFAPRSKILLWLPVLLGLAALFIPTYLRLAHDVWSDEAQAHGPFVLVVVAWLFAKSWRALAAIEGPAAPLLGIVVFAFGLLLYIIGRSQALILLEASAQIPILIGVLLILFGWQAVKLLWFPLMFLFFMVHSPDL